jgi:pimeloyl-ACP methyl ester carboxylesterase
LSAPTAAAVVDLLTAARTWRRRVGVDDNGQLFLIGYSEGGYATVAAHRAMQAGGSTHLANLAAVAAGAGPYHVGVTLDELLRRVREDNPVLGALVSPGLLRYLGSSVRREVRDALLARLLPEDADVVFDATFIDNYLADDRAAVERQSNVHDWAPVAPLRLFHGRDDQTVPYASATETLRAMRERGASDVGLTDCTAVPSGHIECVPPFVVFALGEFAARVRDL